MNNFYLCILSKRYSWLAKLLNYCMRNHSSKKQCDNKLKPFHFFLNGTDKVVGHHLHSLNLLRARVGV